MKNPEKQADLWAKRNPKASRPSWYAQTRPPSCLLEVSGEPEERATQSEIKFGTQTEHWIHNPLEFQDQADSQNEDPFEVQLEDPTEPQLENPIKLQLEDIAGPQLDPLENQGEALPGRDDGGVHNSASVSTIPSEPSGDRAPANRVLQESQGGAPVTNDWERVQLDKAALDSLEEKKRLDDEVLKCYGMALAASTDGCVAT